MRRKIGISVLVILVVLGIAGYFGFQTMISKPLYHPGILRNNDAVHLNPPQQQPGENVWRMGDDVTLHYFSRGRGKNVLMIHGGPGFPTTEAYTGLEPLTGDYRFFYYHQRGCGRSSRPLDRFPSSNNFYDNIQILEKKLGLTAQVADIERIRRILGEEKLILIGHSFGAFIASMYAAEFPEYIAKMVLIAPANVLVFPQEEPGLFEEIRKLLPESMVSDYDDYLDRYFDFDGIFANSESDLAQLNAELVKYYGAALRTGGFALTEPQEFNNGGWMVQAMYFSMGRKHDYRPSLQKVTAPVLVIHGQEDLQSEAISKRYADGFPNADVKTVANAGHFVFMDQPEAFSGLMADFLSGSN